jgi:hypothetical protein
MGEVMKGKFTVNGVYFGVYLGRGRPDTISMETGSCQAAPGAEVVIGEPTAAMGMSADRPWHPGSRLTRIRSHAIGH